MSSLPAGSIALQLNQAEIVALRNGLSLKIDSHLRAKRASLEPDLITFHSKKVDEGNALMARLNSNLELP